MVNAGLIVIASVTAVFAGWHIARSQHYKKKWKDLNGNYGKLKQDLTNALGEVGRVKLLNEDLMKEKVVLDKQVNDLKCHVQNFNDKKSEIKSWIEALEDLQFNAFKYLCVMEERYPSTMLPPSTNKRAVSVAIKHPNFPKNFILIKDFWYDKMDEEDYAFAKSEAKELLETIQKF